MNSKHINYLASIASVFVIFFLGHTCILFAQKSENVSSSKRQAPPLKIAKYFYKKLDGKLGDQRIEIDLMRFGSTLEGHFYFLDKEEKGTIQGTISPSGRISLEEIEGMTDTGELNVVGIFDGKFMTPTTIAGTWHSLDGEQYDTFELEETYSEQSSSFWVVHEGRSYSGTATVDLIYVVMGEENNKKAASKINEYVNSHILNYEHPTSKKQQFGDHSEFLDDFVGRYKEAYQSAQKNETAMPIWDNHHQIILDYNNHNIIALEFVESVFEGGLRPKESINFVNFDLQSGEKITLKEVFEEGFEQKLSAAAEKVFRSKYGFKDIKNFEEEGISFPNNEFALNQNFSLSKGGITFRFNEGEIAAHTMGAFEIFIPYSEVESIIKKNSALEEIMNSHY